MSRISVSIPEELEARLEPVKDKINISQVCREALERRVAALEMADQFEPSEVDVEATVLRFREERELAEVKFEHLGRRSAGLWLNLASYIELRGVAESGSVTDPSRFRLPPAAFRTMKHDLREADSGLEGVSAVAYKAAWIDYVTWVAARVQEAPEGNGAEVAEAAA